MKPLRRFSVPPALPEPLAALSTLARNLRWTWHRPTQDLFAAVDPGLWSPTAPNPFRLLSEVSPRRLDQLASDQAFLARLRGAHEDLQAYLDGDGWYQTLVGAPRSIAYFSPEFGITEAMAQYSGGLGVLAGDHLKTASDLGLPLVGVGLFYRLGYFRQSLSADGRQQESYPAADPEQLSLEPAVCPDGQPARVSVTLPEGLLHARVWRAQVGRVPLFLLDSDDPANPPELRGVTDRLYGGGGEDRLRQEILLGIGGVRALRACGIEPEVFHTNEGHAGFLGLERIRRLVEEEHLDARTAIEAVRAGTVFTTHTPVAAGIDRFGADLIHKYFGPGGQPVGLDVEQLMDLGRDPEYADTFNMAVMGLALAQRANGVSRLHGQVAREMFAALWPGLEPAEVPIGHVTNGVHAPTWVSGAWQGLLERALGPAWATGGGDWPALERVTDEELWATRRAARVALIADARRRLRAAWNAWGVTDGQLGWIDDAFDPDVLTIGFARRVPTYKRLTLMLRDADRLRRLLLDAERPVQILIAGKAHPADKDGKALIHKLVAFASDPAVRHRIAFLPDYDMAMARVLVSGADVWLNNPLRPYEACGTSGMKAALNGALNLSVRDGWWDELYDGRNGWAVPSLDGQGVEGDRRDDYESAAILDLLENAVAPAFYASDGGPSARWLELVRHSLSSLGPAVNASRMVREYTEALYLPAATDSRVLAADGYATARARLQAKDRLRERWDGVRVEAVETGGDTHRGGRLTVQALVRLAGLEPAEVRVEALVGPVDDDGRLSGAGRVPLRPARPRDDGLVPFEGKVPLDHAGAFGLTVRVLPQLPEPTTPAELPLVRWP